MLTKEKLEFKQSRVRNKVRKPEVWDSEEEKDREERQNGAWEG